jgi:hypothetical protein
MGRSLRQVIADLPADRQTRIDARYREMKGRGRGPARAPSVRGQGPGRDRCGLEHQAALGFEDRKAGRHVPVDATKLRRGDRRRAEPRGSPAETSRAAYPASGRRVQGSARAARRNAANAFRRGQARSEAALSEMTISKVTKARCGRTRRDICSGSIYSSAKTRRKLRARYFCGGLIYGF